MQPRAPSPAPTRPATGAGRLRRVAAALIGALFVGGAVAAQTTQAVADETAPARVVSLNVCTDQLAMQLAAPGQLHAISKLARDPRTSAMAEAAQAYRVTSGQAEEVYLMQPDLVLAGSYTTRHTVDLLRRLGIRVDEFAPARGFDDVAENLRRVGAALGRPEAGVAAAARFEADLAALRAELTQAPRAALYYANSYSAGDQTLAGRILRAAGLHNVAAEAGLRAGGTLPLEQLIMLSPDLVVTGAPYPGAAHSEEVLTHPALTAFAGAHRRAALSDADWVCGTPHVLRAVARLRAARDAAMTGEAGP